MSFTVALFSFQKRDNSTKLPVLSTSTDFTGSLKSPSSMITPSIEFSFTFNPYNLNYAYIPEFGRYYWIRDWVWDSGVWMANMEVDVLGTYKGAIGNSTQYVLRCASRVNSYIVDTMYPSTSEYSYTSVNISDYPFITTGTGNATFMLGVVCSYPDNGGSVTYYALTAAQFGAFNNYLLSSIDWAGIDFANLEGMTEPLLKTLFNPYQYVVSCKWFPIAPSSIVPGGAGADAVRYGWWETSVKGQRIPNGVFKYNASFSCVIPRHPQRSRGVYLDGSPFRRIFLKWAPIGIVELPTSYFMGNDNVLQADVIVDLITGEGQIYIRSYDRPGVDGVNYNFKMCCDIPVSQMAYDSTFTAVTSAIQGVANGLSDLGGFGETVGGFISAGVQTATSFTPPELHTVGSSGGKAFLTEPPVLYCQFATMVDDDITHNGSPYCQDIQLSQLSGYILCENAQIPTTGTQQEDEKIRSYLNNGFYFE